MNTLNSKRFVVRKSLIGKNTTVNVTFKSADSVSFISDCAYGATLSGYSIIPSILRDNFSTPVKSYVG